MAEIRVNSFVFEYLTRDEIDAIMEEQIPADWWKYRGQPEFRYRLISGAALHNVSSDDPEALRRGRVDIAVFNAGGVDKTNVVANMTDEEWAAERAKGPAAVSEEPF